MKIIFTSFFMQLLLLASISLNAQVGIGTTVPDASSILDVSSNTKGLLMPRLTTTERNAIVLPAEGLMIYNTTLDDGQINTGIPTSPVWEGLKPHGGSFINSITESEDTNTTFDTYSLVPGMSLTPPPGTYLALFNAQLSSAHTFSSNEGVIDLANLYDELMAYPGGQFHGLTFGSGEVLAPGVYDLTGTPSIAGTLTMDGGGNQEAVFIIRGPGAFTTGAGTTVLLTGGAKPENIFWVSGAAMSTAAGTQMKGTMLGGGNGAGAVTLGAGSVLEGRMFTKLGEITLGAAAEVHIPTAASPVDLGALSTFAMWSSSGAVSDLADTTTYGDVGTAFGLLTMSGFHSGDQFPAGTQSIQTITTLSIFQNAVEVTNGIRSVGVESGIVSLQAMVTVASGEPIEIMWKLDDGQAHLSLRTLTLIHALSQN
jgi:hypothetical protein